LVKKEYFVRTRADEPIQAVLQNGFMMRDSAFVGGAQLISTDFQRVGMAAKFDGDMTVRCNTVFEGRGYKETEVKKL
jgi:hypothetical protein